MTNPAYEATNNDGEKLIAPYESKFSRLWDRFDEACHGNAEHMRDILEATLNALEGAESDIAVLTSALEQAQQYSKKRDEENQDLMLTIGRLRVEREQMESAPNGMMQLSNELAEMKRKCVELTVWYGAMPESNGKTNWTAILHRKGEFLSTGITIDRSEYPDRVRYEADRMSHLIGELTEEPDILAYDANKHSGYTARKEGE